MTRKHFIALADALRSVRPKVGADYYYQWNVCVDAVADACANTSDGKFKRQRFLDYVNGLYGPGGGAIK